MNETTLTIRGNLTAEPERITSSKGAFTTFRVAVNEFHYDQATSSYVDGRTSFYKVVAFRQIGDNVHKCLHKGDPVVVYGTLRISQWETSAGDTRSTPEIEARSVGPDLRWGIATFQRVSAQRRSDQQPSWRNAGSEGPVDAWAGEQATGSEQEPGDSFEPGEDFAPGEDADSTPTSSGPLLQAG